MFERLENFRDFGGFSTPYGKVVSGRLYRSAHHAEISDADLEILFRLGLTLVVDLRTPGERASFPSRRHAQLPVPVLETDLSPSDGDPWHSFLRTAPELNPRSFQQYMGASMNGPLLRRP